MPTNSAQDVLGGGGVETIGGLVEDQQIGSARDRQQQHQLRPHSLGEIGNLALQRKLEHLQVALFQVVAPFGEERTREADELLHRHVGVELLILGNEADAAADLDGVVGVGDGMPKTCAVPLSASNRPISVLMVVVLPAPLRPRNPKMLPAGTRRSRPRRAGGL